MPAAPKPGAKSGGALRGTALFVRRDAPGTP